MKIINKGDTLNIKQKPACKGKFCEEYTFPQKSKSPLLFCKKFCVRFVGDSLEKDKEE